MSSQPFLRAVSDFVMDISGLVNIRPTPGTTDNSGIRFYRENGSYVGLTADKGGKGDIKVAREKFFQLNQEVN